MKVVHKLIVGSIIKTAAVTFGLCILMLVSVQLFANLDGFLKNNVPFMTILRSAVLFTPTAALYALAPSLLFSATFTFSQLTANNELICLYNATLSNRDIIAPVLILGVACCFFQFALQEEVAIPAQKRQAALEESTLGLSSTRDNRNITLSDHEGGYVIHARQYNDIAKRLSHVSVIFLASDGSIRERVDAPSAQWDEKLGRWTLQNASVASIDPASMTVKMNEQELFSDGRLSMRPELFRDNSDDIKTMSLPMATNFLSRMRYLDNEQWKQYRIDYVQRLLGCLTPFVMLFIACTISYRFKKNVLLLTIILSISIAVVYYVTQMLSLLLARQGVISAVWGMVIPMIVIVCIAVLQRMAFGWTHG